MSENTTPHCPLPNIGHCVEERCNFWDPEAGCTGTGVSFGSDPSLDPLFLPNDEDSDN